MNESRPDSSERPRYLWPWFLALAVLVGIIIAALAIRAEANRIKEQRIPMPPATQ